MVGVGRCRAVVGEIEITGERGRYTTITSICHVIRQSVTKRMYKIKLSPQVAPCPPLSNPRLQAFRPPTYPSSKVEHLAITPRRAAIHRQPRVPLPSVPLLAAFHHNSPETALLALLIPRETGMCNMRAR